MTIIQSHASKYTPSCLKALREECNLPLSQMNDVRVCALVSQEHPESLDFDILDRDFVVPKDIDRVMPKGVSLVANLYHLTLIPKDDDGNPIITGVDLFDHMCHFCNMKHAAEKCKGLNDDQISQMEPSAGLRLHLYDDSINLIQPTPYDLCQGAILKDYIGNNAICKNAKRRMNSIGYLVGHCGVVNSPENIRRMNKQLTMGDSVAEIYRTEAEDKDLEKGEKNKARDEMAPAVAANLEKKGREVAKLTIQQIEALLFKVYNINVGGSKKKPDYVNILKKEMENSIGKYEDYLRLLAAGVLDPPAIGDDPSAGEQDKGSINDHVDTDINSDCGGGGAEDTNHTDVGGGQSWDVDLIDEYIWDDDEKDVGEDMNQGGMNGTPARAKECFF